MYCLADGSVLNALDGGESTVVMGHDPKVRIDIERPETSTRVVEQPRITASAEPRRSSGTLWKVLAAVVGLGIILALLVVAGGLIYFNTRPDRSSLNAPNSKPSASPTPAKDENEELREQIANLAKKLDEQKRVSNQVNVPIKLPGRSTTTTSATVNSPGDGFLALRSLPNSEAGERLAKIPHGARVTLGACGPVVTPVKRSGRWCQATYNGLDGWVFDAYLTY